MNPSRPCERPGSRPPHKGPPPPFSPCCDGGYIVEKIVHRQSETICYDGMLTISGLPEPCCCPWTLCAVDVTQIVPCGEDFCGCGSTRLKMTLLCTVADRCGNRMECVSCIEVESCAKARWLQGTNLRRGAQVILGCARFCPPCAFEVSMKVLLQTVYSRCEMLSSAPACPPAYPMPLPLYPPPVRSFR